MQHQPPSADARQAGSVLDIDLGAVRQNYRQLRDRLGGVACAGVVKADGYGLGAAEVATALADEGCGIFFVAHVAEAIALRRTLGGQPDIYVLNGLPPGSEADAASNGLIAVCNSGEQLAAWQKTARRVGVALPVAIQVDSGMARLGMAPADVQSLAATSLDDLDLRLVMSHLACADTPDHPANKAQLSRFETLRRLLPPAPASLANSSGIFLDPRYHFDLARPGAALYGINPNPVLPNPMRQVVRLRAKVVQTREVEAGEGVGYGHSLLSDRAMRLATISIGYADGWPRRAAATAMVDGVALPFAGRVSMDSVILDISALPAGRLGAGDLVELIGETQTVDYLATLSGTIGYEILTGLGSRFDRRYHGRT